VRRGRGTSRQGGFTLLETALYAALVLLLGTPLVSVVLVSTRSTKENDVYNAVVERNRAIMYRVEKELRTAIGASVAVGSEGMAITYTEPAGFDGIAVVPGPTIQYSMRPVAGEKFDGKDNDRNGLVDEGELVRTNTVTLEESVVAAGLDLNACRFTSTGNGVNVTFASFGTMPKTGVFSVSKSGTIHPRN
jgi:hypothetical protein